LLIDIAGRFHRGDDSHFGGIFRKNFIQPLPDDLPPNSHEPLWPIPYLVLFGEPGIASQMDAWMHGCMDG
jgi:hypothetical protein